TPSPVWYRRPTYTHRASASAYPTPPQCTSESAQAPADRPPQSLDSEPPRWQLRKPVRRRSVRRPISPKKRIARLLPSTCVGAHPNAKCPQKGPEVSRILAFSPQAK